MEGVLGLRSRHKKSLKSLDARAAETSERQTPPDPWRHLFFNPFDIQLVAWHPDIWATATQNLELRPGDKVISGAIPIELAPHQNTHLFHGTKHLACFIGQSIGLYQLNKIEAKEVC